MINISEESSKNDFYLVDRILQLSSCISVMEGYVNSHNQIPEMLHLNVLIEKMDTIITELEKEYDTSNCFQKF